MATTTTNNQRGVEATRNRDWKDKCISLDEVTKRYIPNGSAVSIGSGAATAVATLEAMVDDPHLADIQIIQMIPGGNLPHMKQNLDRFRTFSFYSFSRGGSYRLQENGQEGLEDYTPVSIRAVPRLLREGKLRVDVCIMKCTPPHKGFVSLGMGVMETRSFLKHARVVIAEVHESMPWTEGDSKISCQDIDAWILVNGPLLTSEQLWPEFTLHRDDYHEDIKHAIGALVAEEIPNRATLRFGISPSSMWVLPFLQDKQDLGLHTDIFTESMFRLHQQGVITNRYKKIHNGRSVVSQAFGSAELYDFLDRNPVIEFQPSEHVADPIVLQQIDQLVSIVGALKVDLTGQVATDSIAHKFYGGVWTDEDSIRGARYSEGGKAIVVLPSKSLQGRSNILFALPPGTGVSITRSDVEYVVTEYGIAYLYGKPIRERCLALIEIAHPEFRHTLLEECKAHFYLSKFQPGKSFKTLYPSHLESHYTTKTNEEVLIRPIKAVDEDRIRAFFHTLSDHSVYLRYFRKLKSMPQRILQKTADIDYDTDMALVVIPKTPGTNKGQHQDEIVAIAQWISPVFFSAGPSNNNSNHSIPEIAFQVQDSWQGKGLGRYLFQRLVTIAKERGVEKLKADVLGENTSMNRIFETSGVSYVKRYDFGVISYIFTTTGETR